MRVQDPETGHILPWVPPSDISDIFFKYRCNRTDIARHLNISRDTLFEHLRNNPELKAKWDDVKESLPSEWVDQAEKILWYSLSIAKDEPALANKTAMYILDRRGGADWIKKDDDKNAKTEEVLDAVKAINAGNTRALPGSEVPGGSDMANEQPLLHQERPGHEDQVPNELGTARAPIEPTHLRDSAEVPPNRDHNIL